MREVLFVAGEASGDLHAAGVAQALARIRPDLKLTAIGGDRLQAAGAEIIERYDEMAVMGFVEVLRTIPDHFFLLRRLAARLQSGRVALLVLVDYPGFNMKLAEEAAKAGVPVLYYVTPQVWAWGAGRLPKLKRLVKRAAVILPFEENLLRGHGIPAEFVGHPLLDRAVNLPSREAARRKLGIRSDEKVLALFPGSRAQEIERHLEDFVETASRLESQFSGLRVLVSAASTVRIPKEDCPYQLVASDPFTVLRAADAALCKSGTTTLEAAICGCPLVVAYRTGAISYMLARQFVKIPHIALVNVVAGREVAREFVQDDLTPRAVAAALTPLLTEGSAERSRMAADLDEVRGKLGEPGAAERVAGMASEMVIR
ncbi:MAG: lipid-A-disaccharide synthase [Gemmatimonadaceae bacterium]|nr:lipid-A-disaccharide synthase [Gemmatimonadaceae bacterium]